MDRGISFFTGNVLFVCSAARKGRCTEAITEQARGLQNMGVEVSFFLVEERGVSGYLKGAFRLRRFLKDNHFEVIHAHYGLSAIMASLAGARPLVVSLMGSDVFGSWWLLGLVRFFSAYVWPGVIVKSQQMAKRLGAGHAKVIPNGVDMTLFRDITREEARIKLGFSGQRIILWPANPRREVKNIDLAKKAMALLKDQQVELKIISDIPTELMPWYYNAADLVLLTSLWEGSPNVVKEALACNTPVVTTPVGDVSELLTGVEGCEICVPEPECVAEAIKKVFHFGTGINGRVHLAGLDIDSISRRLVEEYLAVSLAGNKNRLK